MATRTISNAGGNWNATGTWVEGAIPTSADDVVATATSGNLIVNAAASCKSLVLTGYNAASAVTHNAGITLTVAGHVTLTAGQYTAAENTAKVTISSTATLTTAGCLLGSLTINKSGGTVTLGDHLSFMGSTGCVLTVQAGTLDLAGKTLAGNSATNRVWVRSNTIGTSAAVTVSSGTFANADFMDIAFSNSGANLDLSAITGLSGDCGGNTMSGGGTLTFTTARVCNWRMAAGGNWSDVSNWDTTDATDRVPLPQDDVTLNCVFASGVTVLGDMPRIGADVDWSDATWSGTAPTWRSELVLEVFGSLTCVSGLQKYWLFGFSCEFYGRGTHTLLWAGFTCYQVYFKTGSYSLLDAMTANYLISFDGGNFTSNGYTITVTYGIRMLGVITRYIDLTGSSIVVTQPGTYYTCNLSGSNITLDMTGTMFTFGAPTDAYANNMGAFAFNDIVLTPSSVRSHKFSGNFSFANMSMASAGALTVTFAGGSSVTMTGDTFLSGTDGAPITITSMDTNQFTLSKSSEGYVSSDWLVIDYCTVDSADKWYAGANSVNSGHNGTPTWTFAAPYTGLPMYLFLSDFYRDGVEVY